MMAALFAGALGITPAQAGVGLFRKEPRESLWEIGECAAKERTIHGAVIFKAGEVRAAGLDVIADEPPLRHAAIRNWPWVKDDPVEQKAKQMELAILIASNARVLEKREL